MKVEFNVRLTQADILELYLVKLKEMDPELLRRFKDMDVTFKYENDAYDSKKSTFLIMAKEKPEMSPKSSAYAIK